MFGHDGWMGFGAGFMWLFWILLIVIVVWAVKAAAGSSGAPRPPEESPMEILKKRYARGEIDEEEFERRRKDLER